MGRCNSCGFKQDFDDPEECIIDECEYCDITYCFSCLRKVWVISGKSRCNTCDDECIYYKDIWTCVIDDYMEYISYIRTIQRCKAIKEDLMALTWHTDRVLDWCDPLAFSWED